MPYIGTSPSQGVRRVHTYTATANQTSFSGAGAEGATLSYKDSNFVDVYQNGVKLGDADYTATSGTAIVLGTGATVSDLVIIVAYDVFSAADTVSKADGGQFDGNVTMAGTLAVTGETTLNNHINIPDSVELKFGADADFKISHNGSKTKLEDTGTGNLEIRGTNIEFYSGDGGETLAKLTDDGAAELYHNNTKRIETTSSGVTVTGNVLISDAGTIGSASDADAIAIASNGVVTFSQAPVFSGGGGGKTLAVTKFSSNTRTSLPAQDTYDFFDTNVTQVKANSKFLVQVHLIGWRDSSGIMNLDLIYDGTTHSGSAIHTYTSQDYGHTVTGLYYIDGASSTGAKNFKFRYDFVSSTGRPFEVWNPTSSDDARISTTTSTIIFTEFDL